jgi:TPP-dependent trihydroxycyclohexane-1,2-dione (THcHDO) dehydratase
VALRPIRFAAEADLILAIGTRRSDFTTASRSLFRNPSATLIQLNAAGFDAEKHGALPLVADARPGLDALDRTLATWAAPADWTTKARGLAAEWNETVTRATASSNAALPSPNRVTAARPLAFRRPSACLLRLSYPVWFRLRRLRHPHYEPQDPATRPDNQGNRGDGEKPGTR